jgi:hypothetical protein
LEAGKYQLCLAHWRTLQHLPPPPHLIYLQPSQRWANPVEVTTHEKYKYKYANLAYEMVPQQLAQHLGVGPKKHEMVFF